jgi:hypothetical protein
MTGMDAAHIPRIRPLAARMREQAGETHIALYRRKFEGLASELEEAAVDAETRQHFFEACRLVS